MSLQEIYQEVLLAHNEHPNHFQVLEHASHQAYGTNPLCGDELTVYVRIKDNKIEAISFTGQGCAICKASASIMTEELLGKTVEAATQEAKDFIELLSDETRPTPENLGEREALLGVRKFPARLKCATLAWHTFLKTLNVASEMDNSAGATCSTGHCC